MIPQDKRVICVTPIYEDLDAACHLFCDLVATFGPDVFLVAVDDGSVRQPIRAAHLAEAKIQGTVLTLRRNVGHQRAIAIGLSFVAENMAAQPMDATSGEDHQDQTIVVLDSDGEDVPGTIPQLLSALDADTDIVVSERKSRVETLRFKVFYAVYKRLFRVLVGRSISFGNFMAMTPAGVRRLAAMQETRTHVAGAVLASRLRVKPLPLDRGARYAGTSKMNLVNLAIHGFRAFMVFAEDVMVRVGFASAAIAMLAVLGAVAAVVLKFIGYSTPGWFSIVLGVLGVVVLQTGSLALMTLLLTGMMRRGIAAPPGDYKNYVDRIEPFDGG